MGYLEDIADGTAPIHTLRLANGASLRVGDLMQRLELIPSPRVGVACHGDPQPTNILLDVNHKWHLIDWEWSGMHHDWRMMVSHLYGWWLTELVTASHDASAQRDADTLVLDMAETDLAPIQPWLEAVRPTFDDMSARYGSPTDIDDLRSYLALLLLRELPRASSTQAAALLTTCLRLLLLEGDLWE